jgi:serine/threonine-protein kinase RsbW
LLEEIMQSQDQAYAYHDAPPSECPREGWSRVEVRTLTEVSGVIKALEATMKTHSYPRKDTFAAALVLREAVSNAIRHGHRGDQTRTVLVNYHISQDEVLIEVADEGFGFNPYLVPSPFAENERTRRWGLLLMRVYMSWLRFNQRGNRVLLCKRRSLPPHA